MKIQELNAYVILFNDDRILLLKRKNGLWEFPGGGVNWGEHPEKAAIREVREETSLQPEQLEFIGVTSATYEKEGNEKHSVYLVYKAKTSGGEPIMAGEHSEYRWLTVNELKLISSQLNLGLNAKEALELI